MTNIGIIGTGFGAKVHVPGFRAVRGARVLGIAGKSAEKTRRVAKEQNIPLVFSSWKELVRDPRIHAVSITTPPPYHQEMAFYAAKHGKHIFCEKPLAMTVQEAKAMLAAARRAGVAHMVDFEFRNLPGLLTLRKLLAKKTLGNIRHVSIAWLTGGRASMNVPLGWQNRTKDGGGVLFSHGSHVVDYMELLFGKAKSVSARLTVAKKNGATAEDTCDMLFALENGATANVSLSNVLPNAHRHAIEAYGDKGSLKLINRDPKNPDYGFRLFHFSSATNKEMEIPILVSKKDRSFADGRVPLFVKTAEKFIAVIERKNAVKPRDGHAVLRGSSPSFIDGLRAQIVMEAAKKSNRTGRRVVIPWS